MKGAWGASGLALLAGIGISIAAPAAQAAAQEQVRSFDIPRQPLNSALTAFARQADAIVVASSNLTASKQSQAVHGTMPARAALERMLEGSGLAATAGADGGYVIKRARVATVRPAAISRIAPEPAARPEAQGDTSGGLDDIVVTAQRREENLQDVPVAVSVVSGALLESSGIANTDAISQAVPAVQMQRSGPSGLFYVRGVGTTNAAAGEEGANAFYVDGVYIADLAQTITYFNSIQRIEVLKGPQGTLFGRNATGGLIHIITREPGDELVVKAKAGYGNYQTATGQLYVGGPVSSNLSLDIALTGQDQGKGWGRNLTRNTEVKKDDYWGMRSKAVFRPSDSLKITLAGDYYDLKGDTTIAWRIDESNLGQNGYLSPGGHDTTANDPSLSHVRNWGVSLTVAADLGFADLTSITAYRNSRNHTFFDIDTGPTPLVHYDYVIRTRSLQQELRLASKQTYPLEWQMGAFYLRTKASNFQAQRGSVYAPQARLGQNIDGRMTTDSYAVFGQVTYAVTPTTFLTGGLRYTDDQRTFRGILTPVNLDGSFGAPTIYPRPGLDLFDRELNYNELTYRLSLRQDLTDRISAYASFNRGFKSGAFSLQNFNNPPYLPQYINAYEVGVKSELFDRHLRLNISAFRYDIDDYQVRSIVNGINYVFNAATVKVDGLDIDFEASPVRNVRIFGGATLLDSKFRDFKNGFYYVLAPGNCATGPTGPQTGGLVECVGDLSGGVTPNAPKFAASIGGSFRVPVSETGELVFSALYSYNSGYAFEPENRLRQDSFSILNGSVEYRLNERFAIELWGKNLTNTRHYYQRTSSRFGAWANQAAPRTYGVNLSYDY
ncbi:MAG: TonB-dependent receptor [Novosphingobium sp.]